MKFQLASRHGGANIVTRKGSRAVSSSVSYSLSSLSLFISILFCLVVALLGLCWGPSPPGVALTIIAEATRIPPPYRHNMNNTNYTISNSSSSSPSPSRSPFITASAVLGRSATPSTTSSFSASQSVSLSVSKIPLVTSTDSVTGTISAMKTASASLSRSNLTTQTKSKLATPSRTPRIRTPPVTASHSLTISKMKTASLSESKSAPTLSLSLTRWPTVTKSLIPSMTESLTASETNSISHTVSPSPGTQTVTASKVRSGTGTLFPPPTATVTNSPPKTFTSTASRSLLGTITQTIGGTASYSPSSTLRESSTLSAVFTSSASPSMSLPLSGTADVTLTRTPPKTETVPPTGSEPITVSKSVPLTSTVSTSLSSSMSPSQTASFTQSVSSSSSGTASVSLQPTSTVTTSHSISKSSTPPITPSLSTSVSRSISTTVSPSKGTKTGTISPPPTETATGTTTLSGTASQSLSVGTPSSMATATMTLSTSGTISTSQSASASLSSTYSSSGTASVSTTLSLSKSDTLSSTVSSSLSITVSMSATTTCSVSASRTRGTPSMSLSLPPTTTVPPPTTTVPPTPTRTLPTSCPDDCMNGKCERAPQWAFVHLCVCYRTDARGYWTGGDEGGPCDKCMPGYYGDKCTSVCPGGSCAICSGHGTCNDGTLGDGVCTCTETAARGHWAGPSCTLCLTGWYGSDCRQECTCTQFGKCSDGRSGNGGCTCIVDGWSGDSCEICDPSKVAACVLTCESDADGVECYGNGKCETWGFEARCACNANYGGTGCQNRCPNATGPVCGGPSNGRCRQGSNETGTCQCYGNFAEPECTTCKSGYTGANCNSECPGGVLRPCNNSGTCLRDGTCQCDGEFAGASCTLPCPRNMTGSVCSGHGTCAGLDAHCVCHSNAEDGYWNGTLCDICDDAHGGAGCRATCPVADGEVCSGPSKGFCNKATGQCSCINGFCGAYCDSTPDRQCSSCDYVYQYGLDCQGICDCKNSGTCDAGRAGSGVCTCTSGWAGTDCGTPCPGGVTNPCNGHGRCLSDATCTCNAGYAGLQCEKMCPGGGTCSGHGTCSDGRYGSGNCTCAANYVWPITGCATSCNCNGHGRCDYPSPICTCDTAYYVGDRCEQCRPGGYGSTTCAIPCYNGTTVGYECVCHAGYGGPSCDILCPSTPNGPCNGNGTCSKITGLCVCATGWVGPVCTCNSTTCRAANKYTVCNSATAQCVCDTNRGGADCSECLFGYYGTTCMLPCDCSGNGPCDIDTGLCQCYTDDTRGYWTGGLCSQCLDGYMGSDCRQKSNAVSVMSTLRSAATNDVSQLYAYFDSGRGILYVGGNPLNAAFNVSSVLPTFITGGHLHNDSVTNVPICGDIGGASMINVSGVQKMFYIVQPNLTCAGILTSYTAPIGSGTFANMTLFSSNAFFNALAIDHVDRQMAFFFHEVSTNTICTIIDSTNQELYCYILQTNNPMQTTFYVQQLPTRSIRAAVLSKRSRGTIYLAGSDRQNLCAIQVAYTTQIPPTPQPISIASFRNQYNNRTCTIVDSLFEVGHLLLFTIVQEVMYLSAYDLRTNTFYKPVEMGASAQRTNALTYDNTSKIGIAVFKTRVMKFTIDEETRTIAAYGQTYVTSDKVSQLILHPSIQAVYAPLSQARGIEVFRFMLLEVLSIYPTHAERIGGTVVTVSGRGFRDVSTLQCKMGDVLVKALYVSPTRLLCTAPVVLTTKSCVTDYVEVSTTSIVYTQNLIGLERPDSPTLEKAVPTYARVGMPVTIILTGRGFVNTPYATCRFSDVGVTTVYSNATFNATTGTYSCMSPNASSPWSPTALLHLSLDGQAFGTHPLSFLIVGSASGIAVVPSSSSAVSAPMTTLSPSIGVRIVDERGNELGEVDEVSRSVTIVSPLGAYGTEGVTVGGVAVLSNFTLVSPRAGVWTAQAIVGTWTVNFFMTIRYGTMTQLRVKTEPLQQGDIIIPGQAIPRQTEVEGVDAAGNVVYDSSGLVVNATLAPIDPLTGELLLFDNETKALGQIIFSNAGVATLPQLVVVPMFGIQYTLFFTILGNNLINATSMYFYPSCSVSMFFVSGMRECIDCPTGQAKCNGSDYLVANPGYWRASALSLSFYECPRREVCLGGFYGGCAPGYTGALCAVCEDGFGLGYRGTCDECAGIGGDIAVTILLLIALFCLLVFGVLMVIQNYSVPESLIGRTITTGIIFLCYLQSVTLLGLLDLGATEIFTSALALIAVIADFRFYGLHPTACILSRTGLNLQYMSLTYTLAFIIFTVGVAAAVKLLLNRFPTLLMSEEAMAAREGRLSMQEAISSLRIRSTANSREAEAKRQQQSASRRRRLSRKGSGGGGDDDDLGIDRYSLAVKEHSYKALFMASGQICVLFLMQSVALTTFSLFDCVDIESDSGVTPYLRNDMRVACDSTEYMSYHGIAMFIVIVIAAGLPCLVVFGIALARRHLTTESYRLWTCTMTYGLQDRAFFYQGMVIARRVICLCAIVFANNPIDAYAVVWALTAFLSIQVFIQPYAYAPHNRYECFATASVIITGNICFLFRATSGDEVHKLLTALLLILIIATILYLFYVLLHDVVVHFYREIRHERIERMDFNTGMEVVNVQEMDELALEGADGDDDDKRARKREAAAVAAASDVMLVKAVTAKKAKVGGDGSPVFSTGTGFDPLSSRFTRTQVSKKYVPPSATEREDQKNRRSGNSSRRGVLNIEVLQEDGDYADNNNAETASQADTWYQRRQLERKSSKLSESYDIARGGRGGGSGERRGTDGGHTLTRAELSAMANVNATGGDDPHHYHDQQQVYMLTDDYNLLQQHRSPGGGGLNRSRSPLADFDPLEGLMGEEEEMGSKSAAEDARQQHNAGVGGGNDEVAEGSFAFSASDPPLLLAEEVMASTVYTNTNHNSNDHGVGVGGLSPAHTNRNRKSGSAIHQSKSVFDGTISDAEEEGGGRGERGRGKNNTTATADGGEEDYLRRGSRAEERSRRRGGAAANAKVDPNNNGLTSSASLPLAVVTTNRSAGSLTYSASSPPSVPSAAAAPKKPSSIQDLKAHFARRQAQQHREMGLIDGGGAGDGDVGGGAFPPPQTTADEAPNSSSAPATSASAAASASKRGNYHHNNNRGEISPPNSARGAAGRSRSAAAFEGGARGSGGGGGGGLRPSSSSPSQPSRRSGPSSHGNAAANSSKHRYFDL